MRAIVLQEPGRFVARRVPEPQSPGPGDALVRVKAVGICGTDIHAYRGRQPFFRYPRILGHELGVEVVETGREVSQVRPGDRCAVEPYLYCGACAACAAGKTNCCSSLQVLGVHVDGGLQEYLVVPARNLHRSESMGFEPLALVETLGIGAHAVDRAAVRRGETVLVLGAGPIGLSVATFADLAGGATVVADTDPARLRFAAGAAPRCEPLPADADLAERLAERTGGEMAAVVFDATGDAGSMARALQYVAQGGRLVFVGLVQADIPIADPEFHRREATLCATRNATAADYARILPLVESGFIDATPWISHRTSLDALPLVFERWLEPEAHLLKGMVQVM